MSELITIPMMEIEEQKKIIEAQEKLIESLEKNIDVFKENDDIRKVIIDYQELRIKKLKQENKDLKNKLAECHEALSETEGAIEETKDLAQKAGCYNLLLKKTYDEDLVKKDLVIIELQEKLIESKNKLAALNGQKDTAYSERNKLVAHLSKIYYAELARHDETDIHWEDDWRNIVSMHAPKGRQMSWHIHDSEIEMFSHLNFDGGYLWDGHSTEEKYKRLSEISDGRLFCSKCESEIMRAKHRKMFPRYE